MGLNVCPAVQRLRLQARPWAQNGPAGPRSRCQLSGVRRP
jgi:hypothetical protein